MVNDDQEISIQEIVGVIRHRWKLIVFPALIASLVAGTISVLMPKKYESYALLRIGYVGTQPFDSVATAKVIMKSVPVEELIKTKSGLSNTDSLRYEETDSLLKISAKEPTPEDAQTLVRAAAEVLVERHRKASEYAQQRLGRMVTYVKEIMRPVPLSAGINEFIVEQTRIEVEPILAKKPIINKAKLIMLLAFISVAFVDMLIAFYREGAKSK